MDKKCENYEKIVSEICSRLKVGKNLDAKHGEFVLAGCRCSYFYLEGFLNKQALERIVSGIELLPTEAWKNCKRAEDFVKCYLHIAECVPTSKEQAILKVLSGFLLLIFEGHENEFLTAEVRITPQRSIEEPTKGKTLRGPHEGFCENLVTNLALLRRRIKTTDFCAREITLGDRTQTRIAVCYLEELANPEEVSTIIDRLTSIQTQAVCMGEQTIATHLFNNRGMNLLNPLPRARFSERPDTCAAEIAEGKIVLLIDTTPNAVLLPIALFDYFEECDDYYFPPITATYLRLIRFFSFIAGVFLVPCWLLLVNLTVQVPESFAFVQVNDPYSVPIFLQLILIEFAIDALKLASLNTPDPLTNSLSVVGGLLLGDFAVKSGWFVPQTILYSAIVTILSFLPNNYELGYSMKFARILLIVAVEIGGLWGFFAGCIIIVLFAFGMKGVVGKGYFYPLFPFSAGGIKKIFIRSRVGRESQK